MNGETKRVSVVQFQTRPGEAVAEGNRLSSSRPPRNSTRPNWSSSRKKTEQVSVELDEMRNALAAQGRDEACVVSMVFPVVLLWSVATDRIVFFSFACICGCAGRGCCVQPRLSPLHFSFIECRSVFDMCSYIAAMSSEANDAHQG